MAKTVITETAALVDELTDLRAQIAALQTREEALKIAFRHYGTSSHVGTYTEVTVAEARITSTPDADLKAHYDAALALTKATLGSAYIETHTDRKLASAAVSVTARKVLALAA
jgi:N-methylhydantoinase B/oxoprolinase/acetone carboxylase alpha subunit